MENLFVKTFIKCAQQICQHLEYKDITALCCTNKPISEFLSNPENSNDIWRSARYKFTTILYTDPPEGLSEREYAKLFSSVDTCQCCRRTDKQNWLQELMWDGEAHYWIPHLLYLSKKYTSLKGNTRLVAKWIEARKAFLNRLIKDALERHRMLSRTTFSIFYQKERVESGNNIKSVDPLSIKTYDRVNLSAPSSLKKAAVSTTNHLEPQLRQGPSKKFAPAKEKKKKAESKLRQKKKKLKFKNKKAKAKEKNATDSPRNKEKDHLLATSKTTPQTQKEIPSNTELAPPDVPATATTSNTLSPTVDPSPAGVPGQFNQVNSSVFPIDNILGPAIKSKRREILNGLRQYTLTSNTPQGTYGIRTDEPIFEFLPMCNTFKAPPSEQNLWMIYSPQFLSDVIQAIRYEAINISQVCSANQRPGNAFTLAGAIAHRFDRYPVFQCKICKLSQVDMIQQVKNHVAVIHHIYEELPTNAIEVNELKMIEYLVEGFDI
ncbi:4291_t:CDS:2 [Acaulospora colombiana]|uniref:4291_t:CDS:1 n=1 Tax=Acaulospora colombiana TaxID=27376 RepID=A0ACA9K5C0_9GLOM|nr:4291_t:CDS:2 [Acaulospora colombiana]